MRLKRSLRWHIYHVRRDGARALASKIEARFVVPLVGFVGALIYLVFLALIRLRKRVYLVTIRTHRIGHLSLDPGIALALIAKTIAKDTKGTQHSPFIVWLGHRRVANSWLLNAWRKVGVPVSAAPLPGLDCYNNHIRKSRLVTLIDPAGGMPRNWGSFQSPRPVFTDRETTYARGALHELGLPDDASWVCINARDSAYLSKALPGDWSEEEYRNADITTFVPAAEMLAARGFYVFRMGATVNKPILTTNSRIIDYAVTGYRTEFLDVFLSARCEMFISTGSGIDSLACLYQKPLVLVNLSPFVGGLKACWNLGSLCVAIPKHHDHPDGSSWALSNLLQEGFGKLDRSSDYKEKGVILRDNTAEEIQKVCTEALALSQVNHSQFPAMSASQQAFWQTVSRFDPTAQYRSKTVRVGEDFLKENPCWSV